MKINTKGQVTIPADLRDAIGIRPGDEVDVVADGDVLRIVKRANAPTRGQRLVSRLRGSAGPGPSTDELMELLRGE